MVRLYFWQVTEKASHQDLLALHSQPCLELAGCCVPVPLYTSPSCTGLQLAAFVCFWEIFFVLGSVPVSQLHPASSEFTSQGCRDILPPPGAPGRSSAPGSVAGLGSQGTEQTGLCELVPSSPQQTASSCFVLRSRGYPRPARCVLRAEGMHFPLSVYPGRAPPPPALPYPAGCDAPSRQWITLPGRSQEPQL